MLRATASLLLLVTSASAAAPEYSADRAERDLATALAGRTPGKPVNCVDQSRLQGPEVINDRIIIYRQSGGKIWLTGVKPSCPALNGDMILITETFGTQLCRNDRFSTVPRGGGVPSAYCFFTDFTPYDKPAKQ